MGNYLLYYGAFNPVRAEDELVVPPDTPLMSFASDIRPLFRDRDVNCMRARQLDLSQYDVVRVWAEEIYSQLESKAMPKDGAHWSPEQLKVLRDWIDGGKAP